MEARHALSKLLNQRVKTVNLLLNDRLVSLVVQCFSERLEVTLVSFELQFRLHLLNNHLKLTNVHPAIIT
jgi:hypothetical protein